MQFKVHNLTLHIKVLFKTEHMTHSQNLNQKPQALSALVKWMLFGGGIALTTILFFVIGAGKGRPEWGTYWIIKPLILTPLVGAFGGALAYRITKLGLNRILTIVIGVVGFLIVLWIGIVLGLNGTMWD